MLGGIFGMHWGVCARVYTVHVCMCVCVSISHGLLMQALLLTTQIQILAPLLLTVSKREAS